MTEFNKTADVFRPRTARRFVVQADLCRSSYEDARAMLKETPLALCLGEGNVLACAALLDSIWEHDRVPYWSVPDAMLATPLAWCLLGSTGCVFSVPAP